MDFPARLDQHLLRHARLYTAVLWVLALAITFAPILTASDSPFLTGRFGDSDDLLRLKQVKDLLGLSGSEPKSWFDLREQRIGPSPGLDSHWSRLLDAMLAVLVLGFKPLIGPEKAVWLMQYVWPLALILPMLWLAYATGKALHNRASGLCALFYLACAGSPAFMHFHPGRIDHHNLQILLAFAGLYACMRLDGTARPAVVSGLLMALSLAIGFDTLPLMLLIGLVVIWRYIENGYRQEWTGFVLSASLGALGLLVAQTHPDRMFYSACDALGFNLIVLLLSGSATSLFLIARQQPDTVEHRFRLMFFPVIFAVVVGIAYDPLCIQGPYGEQTRHLWPLLSGLDVQAQTLPPVWGGKTGLVLILAPLLAGGLVLLAMRDRLTPARFFLLAGWMLTSGMMAGWMPDHAVSPALFVTPLIGLGLVLTFERVKRLWPRTSLAVALVCTVPVVLGLLTMARGPADTPARSVAEAKVHCDRPEDFYFLKRQNRGMVAASLDLAIPVLVTTQHSVTAAPYPRLAERLIDHVKAFGGDEKTFLDYLARTNSEYVVLCNSNDPAARKGSSVTARLLRGETINRLTPVREPPLQITGQGVARGQPVLIWQVRSSNQQE